ARTLVADRAAGGPAVFDRDRRVAAPVARIGPEVLVFIEVVRREHIARQRLDAFRRLAGRRRADELPRRRSSLVRRGTAVSLVSGVPLVAHVPWVAWVWRWTSEASTVSSADHRQRGRVDQDGRAASDALKVDLWALLRRQRRRNRDGESERCEPRAQVAVLRHRSSPVPRSR